MTPPTIEAPRHTGQVRPHRWCVELVLDLCGYTDAIDLTRLTVATVGQVTDAVTGPILDRLAATGPADSPWHELRGCVRRWESPAAELPALADVDVVVGVSADVGLFERSLDLLADGGSCGFVLEDHWLRSEAGRRLRAKIATRGFAVDAVITTDGTALLEAGGLAAPAIIVIRHGPQEEAVLAHAGRDFGQRDTEPLLDWIDFGEATFQGPNLHATRVPHWPTSSAPWPTAAA